MCDWEKNPHVILTLVFYKPQSIYTHVSSGPQHWKTYAYRPWYQRVQP